MREETGRESCYYLQDELGSLIRLMDRNGELAESYGYDEFGQELYGNREETAGRSMTGSIQPFGYTGYQYDKTAGTYYAQAREYRAELGRFAAVDTIKGSTAAPYTLNEYGYCWGNPMVLVDWNGAWPTWEDVENAIDQGTDAVGSMVIGLYNYAVEGYNYLVKDLNGTATLKISANANALLGVYVDIGVSVDWKGNVALQWSYAVPGVDDTMSVGVFDIGGALGLSITDAKDVNGLLGKSSSLGVSGGYLGYGAIDLISFEEMEDMNGDIDGFQIAGGIGAGIDIHMMETNTKEIYSYNIFQILGSTLDFLFRRGENSKCVE